MKMSANQQTSQAATESGVPPGLLVLDLFGLTVNLIVVGISFWLALTPALGGPPDAHWWVLLTQTSLPLVGALIVWSTHGRYSLFRGVPARFKTVKRCLPLYGFWFPILGALFMHYDYVHFISKTAIVPLASIIGTAFLVIAGLPEARVLINGLQRVFLVLAIFISGAYGYATVLQLNILLDHSPPTIFQAVVSQKEKSQPGSRKLWIEPWSRHSTSQGIVVSYDLFNSVQPGGTVCMVVREGGLGTPWYTAQECPWRGGKVLLGPGDSF
jgi:hypothetical protein